MDNEHAAPAQNRFTLLLRLGAGIVLGTVFGLAMKAGGWPLPVCVTATFNEHFLEFLDFSVPLLVLGYVTSGIAGLGKGAGKALARRWPFPPSSSLPRASARSGAPGWLCRTCCRQASTCRSLRAAAWSTCRNCS